MADDRNAWRWQHVAIGVELFAGPFGGFGMDALWKMAEVEAIAAGYLYEDAW